MKSVVLSGEGCGGDGFFFLTLGPSWPHFFMFINMLCTSFLIGSQAQFVSKLDVHVYEEFYVLDACCLLTLLTLKQVLLNSQGCVCLTPVTGGS